MSEQNITQKIAANTLWMIVGKFGVTFLGLLIIAQLARSLGVFGYGEYSTVFGFLVFFGTLADLGFYQILVREVARRPDEQARITNNILTIRTIFALIAYTSAIGLVWLFPYSTTVKFGVMILAVANLFSSLNSTLVGVFQARQRMDRAVLSDVISRVLLLIMIFTALRFNWNLLAILALYGIANLVNLLISIQFIQPFFKVRFLHEPALWRSLAREAWSMGVVGIFLILYFKIDIVILSLLRSSVDVGIYGITYKILEILVLIPGIFIGNVMPPLTRLLNGPHKDLQDLIQTAADILTILGIPTVLGLIVLAGPAIQIVGGSDYLTASTVSLNGYPLTAVHTLILLTLSLVAIFPTYLSSMYLIASGEQRRLIKPASQAFLLNLILNLLLIPRFGYIAAAITTILTEFFIFFTVRQLAQNLLPLNLSRKRFWLALMVGFIMVAVIWQLRALPVIIPIVVGGVIYLGGLIAFRVIPRNPITFFRPSVSATTN